MHPCVLINVSSFWGDGFCYALPNPGLLKLSTHGDNKGPVVIGELITGVVDGGGFLIRP